MAGGTSTGASGSTLKIRKRRTPSVILRLWSSLLEQFGRPPRTGTSGSRPRFAARSRRPACAGPSCSRASGFRRPRSARAPVARARRGPGRPAPRPASEPARIRVLLPKAATHYSYRGANSIDPSSGGGGAGRRAAGARRGAPARVRERGRAAGAGLGFGRRAVGAGAVVASGGGGVSGSAPVRGLLPAPRELQRSGPAPCASGACAAGGGAGGSTPISPTSGGSGAGSGRPQEVREEPAGPRARRRPPPPTSRSR